jgi:hypothetical protein
MNWTLSARDAPLQFPPSQYTIPMKIPLLSRRSSPLTIQPRKADRKRQTLPVKILGANVKAATRDISFSGVYFETDSSFRVDSIIKMTIDFDSPQAMQLECEGTIVRVEVHGSDKVGVAVRINHKTLALTTH